MREPSRHAYGLVAPLFEMAKVCANHLAHFGIGRYAGSMLSTKLKVTGVDLFSAGDFTGGEGTEDIVLADPGAGVYKRLVISDDKLVGAVMYGDTVDGAWYFKLLREGAASATSATSSCSASPTSATRATSGRTAPRRWPTTPRCAAATACARARSSRRSRRRACSRSRRCASAPRPRRRAARAPGWWSRS
jgi:nitrite reductase (NADH) large subunit